MLANYLGWIWPQLWYQVWDYMYTLFIILAYVIGICEALD